MKFDPRLFAAKLILIILIFVGYVFFRASASKVAVPPDLYISDNNELNMMRSDHFKLIYFAGSLDRAKLDIILGLANFLKTNGVNNLDVILLYNIIEPGVFLNIPNFYKFPEDRFPFFSGHRRSRFYLFLGEGRLLDQGNAEIPSLYSYRAIGKALGISLSRWEFSLIVSLNERISLNEYFGFLDKYRNSSIPSDFLFLFLEDACSTCLSGNIINKLDRLIDYNDRVIGFVVLPSTFTDIDLSNIKLNNDFAFNFIRSDSAIEDYSSRAVQDYYSSTSNGLVIILQCCPVIS